MQIYSYICFVAHSLPIMEQNSDKIESGTQNNILKLNLRSFYPVILKTWVYRAKKKRRKV